MRAADVPIWETFLDRYGENYSGFDYDVRLGEGVDPGDECEPWMAQDWALQTCLRADAIGYELRYTTIFEVKPRANAASIGQILCYKILYDESHLGDPESIPALVVSVCDRDFVRIASRYGIRVFCM